MTKNAESLEQLTENKTNDSRHAYNYKITNLNELKQLLSIMIDKSNDKPSKGYCRNSPTKDMIISDRIFANSLNNVYVKESKIHGIGVFATRNISEGELITLYPGDILIYSPNEYKKMKKIHHSFSFGTHISNKIKNLCGDETYRKFLKTYRFNINLIESIIGMPSLINDPTYLGHICNDGAKSSLKNDIEIYNEISMLKRNARFDVIYDCCTVILATKNISADDEILVSYGETYWKNYYDE